MTIRTRRRRTTAQPRAAHGLPEYDWGTAPVEQLATRRQLRAAGLRPGGQEPVAILRCKACATRPQRTCTRAAYLYRVDLALPVRPMTLAKEAALDKAMAARTTCPKYRRRYHHVRNGVNDSSSLKNGAINSCRRTHRRRRKADE